MKNTQKLYKVYVSTGRNKANLNRTAISIFSADDNLQEIIDFLTFDHICAGYRLNNYFCSHPMPYHEAIELAEDRSRVVESVLNHTA